MALSTAAIRSLLEALGEPALIVDRGIVRLANRAAKEILGPGIDDSDIRLAIRHPQALEQLLASRPGDIDISGVGGFERPWTLSIAAIEDGAVLVRLIDRTAAAAAEKMRVDFVANASHELRTPLSTVLGYAETLADEADLDSVLRRRFAGVIRTEAKRMLAIIEDLMNLSRIEAGRFVAPTEIIALGDLIRSVAETAQASIEGDQCTIELAIDAGLPPVRGDQPQLVQLLDNLLTNALRYGCTAEQKSVTISAQAADGWIALSVADKGPGIPRDQLPRVTERFYRVDPARSRDSGGTGLGLAIVKHIVERHRGSLDIRSVPGQGTDVVVRLPLAG